MNQMPQPQPQPDPATGTAVVGDTQMPAGHNGRVAGIQTGRKPVTSPTPLEERREAHAEAAAMPPHWARSNLCIWAQRYGTPRLHLQCTGRVLALAPLSHECLCECHDPEEQA